MKQFELEYVLHASQKVIYDRLSSASGLSEWFADDVNQKGKIFTFMWEGSEQKAELLNKRDNRLVRFHWLDSEDEESFFEFKIEIDALTNDLSLIVTDFAEEDEIDESIELWDSQISELKQVLGI
ncbi:START-like domain-containing protein [Labilibaculum sp.]|uniref:START-like domain-containing protein n=1 Tax=Labilibaculum sp. TaxID=2060723 RepID=UPI0035656DA5